MHPQVIGLPAYSVFLVIGDLVGAIIAIFGARRFGFRRVQAVVAVFGVNVAALFGAKVFAIIERGGGLAPLSTELFGGYRYPGAVIGEAVGLLIVRWRGRISASALADVLAPACGFAMSIIRIGCLLAGCCSGTLSTLPWAIHFPRYSLVWHEQRHAGVLTLEAPISRGVHPLQVYFGLLSLGLGCLALWFQSRKKYDGQVFLLYVALYGFGQFWLEFFRFSPLPHVQYASLAVALIASAVLIAKASGLTSSQRLAPVPTG